MSSSEMRSSSAPGVLYVIATPIGNLDDLTDRGRHYLAKADLVAAEDTRHTGRLLQHLGLDKPMMALHDHNERARAAAIVAALGRGDNVALVSDAGTPLISDPGYVVVRDVRAAGFQVSPVPGACALVAALSAAGLPTDHFLFAGFLPAKRSGRQAAMKARVRETATLVYYESPHRILDMMADAVAVFGPDRPCVLGRELTKAFETFYAGTAGEVLDTLAADPNGTRGEFVVMFQGAPPEPASESVNLDADRLLRLLMDELPVKKAAKIVAEVSGLSKNDLYQRALALKDATGN